MLSYDFTTSGQPDRLARVLADEEQIAQAAPPPATRRHPRLKRILYIGLVLFILLFGYLLVTAPLSKSLQPIAAPSITLLSAEGKPIARRGAVTDQPVDVEELPEHIPNAFLAIEDRRFYNHSGIDFWGIMRAAVVNLKAGGVVEGGSTISQQLAKLAFLSSDRTYGRKAQEVLLAFWLEAWLPKEEILSRYLSSVYFGDNVYGLRAAANHYFSKKPEKLTVEQAAMLAGLMKAPSRLAPTSNLKGARARGNVVEQAMVDAGMISAEKARKLPVVKLKRGPVKDLPTGTYFADWVFPQAQESAERSYGEQRIQTTLEDRLQRQAVQAIRAAGVGSQVALIAMRPDGRVVAMVGGKSYKQSPFNRATQAKRQPGSAFKLFVYLAALRDGFTPRDIIEDRPITVGKWSPKNYESQYRGPITLREAFAVSSNSASVQLSERVGRERVIRAARDLGVRSELTNQPSLALGTSGTTLMEMVAAYAAVAGNAYPVRARGLAEVEEESWYGRLMDRQSSFSERVRTQMLELLWSAANEGTGKAAALRINTFGKTGTTQDSRDALFIGFAGDLVTGVWIGNDNNSPIKGASGGGMPARIWRNFMSGAVSQTGAGPQAPPPMIEAPVVDPGIVFQPQIVEGYDVEGGYVGPEGGFVPGDAPPRPERDFEAAPPPPSDEDVPPGDDIPTLAPPPPPPPEEELLEDEE